LHEIMPRVGRPWGPLVPPSALPRDSGCGSRLPAGIQLDACRAGAIERHDPGSFKKHGHPSRRRSRQVPLQVVVQGSGCAVHGIGAADGRPSLTAEEVGNFFQRPPRQRRPGLLRAEQQRNAIRGVPRDREPPARSRRPQLFSGLNGCPKRRLDSRHRTSLGPRGIRHNIRICRRVGYRDRARRGAPDPIPAVPLVERSLRCRLPVEGTQSGRWAPVAPSMSSRRMSAWAEPHVGTFITCRN
jgi:hypothetical protein